ncbi:MAG: RNA polymerase sigma factor, partial [Polaribacter sp.]|nr:RNA polymerase sigma factor [Polaribacter sp.]
LEVILSDENEEEIDYTDLQPNYVLQTLNDLKENYKIALTLHLIEGYDYEEIATIMDFTNENVRTTISRAKRKLQQILLENNPKLSKYGK